MPLSSKPGFFARYKLNLRDILHSSHIDLLGSKAVKPRAPSTIRADFEDNSEAKDLNEAPPISAQTIAPGAGEGPYPFTDLAAIPSYNITRRHSAPTLPPGAAESTPPIEMPGCPHQSYAVHEPSSLVRALEDATHRLGHVSVRLREAKTELDLLATEAKGNTHHIRYLHDEQQTKDRKVHSLRKEVVRMIVSIVVLKQRNQALTARLEHLQTDCRVYSRVIHQGTRKQLELQGEIRELERQRERDRGALKAVRARTWVPGWCWKAKIAELAMKLDGAEMLVRERGGTISELDAEIVELREKLGEYR
ncbi:hypothetical protein LTR12_006534 [Friedmanniomyces endolithicus]|nr:hypothetical protein LTR74_004476 [Friedmanniomyces endolithicus]KAK1819088.1 hypothetical protein LTR12_006534 [Friedmanniomyces endolithicus]